MEDGTRSEYQFLAPIFEEHAKSTVVPNLVNLLQLLAGPKLGYQIDRYQHSLQSATRAHRNGERIDLVVGALLHDVGDVFAPDNHSEAAASILAPYVDEECHWIVKHHGIFQGYYYFHHMDGDRNARDLYAESPYYEPCVRFCADYDQTSFDPTYDTMPIEAFIPMMEDVFSRPSRIPGVAPLTG